MTNAVETLASYKPRAENFTSINYVCVKTGNRTGGRIIHGQDEVVIKRLIAQDLESLTQEGLPSVVRNDVANKSANVEAA